MSVPTEPAISSQHTNLSTMDTDAWVDLALRKLQKKARSNRMRNMREQVYASLQQQGRSDITMDMIKITYQPYNQKYIVRIDAKSNDTSDEAIKESAASCL